jgi:hypothetical protein
MIWEQNADVMDLVLRDNDTDKDRVMAMIPSLFGISDKATYLSYRAMGLGTVDTLAIMDLDEEVLEIWRSGDPYFIDFERDNLVKLQASLGPELIRLGFMRNMALFVSQDAKIIKQATVGGLESLNKLEYQYLMKVRSSYGPSDLVAMNRAMGEDVGDASVVINLNWGPGQSQSIERAVEGDYREVEYDDETD